MTCCGLISCSFNLIHSGGVSQNFLNCLLQHSVLFGKNGSGVTYILLVYFCCWCFSFWELLIKGYSMRLGLISSFRVYKNNFSIFTTSIFSSSNISPLQHFSTMMASLERGMMCKRVERPVTLDLHCFFSHQSPPVLNISE